MCNGSGCNGSGESISHLSLMLGKEFGITWITPPNIGYLLSSWKTKALDADGCFSCKSFLTILSAESLPPYPHHKIWYSAAPPRVKAFNWVVSLNRQNTTDILQRRHPYMALFPSVCCLCRVTVESGNHLFIHCPFASCNKGMEIFPVYSFHILCDADFNMGCFLVVGWRGEWCLW